MSLRLPATLPSWQASFRSRSFTQSFARGLGRPNQLVAPCRRCDFSKSAQSGAQRKAGTSQAHKRATAKPSESLISGSRKPAAYEGLSDKMALRTTPTLLYQASSYTDYLFWCYTIGSILFASAWFNSRTPLYVRPGGVPQWVPFATSVSSCLIACVGFWMFLKPQNMVRAISCLPSSAKSGPGSRSPLLQIERTSMSPFKQRKLTTVHPSDVTLSSHIFNVDPEQKLEATIAEIARREDRLRAFAKTNLFTLPHRLVGYWVRRGFIGIRRAVTLKGFHYLHIRGNNRAWKLDKYPAWALDDGKALDKLVKIKIA